MPILFEASIVKTVNLVSLCCSKKVGSMILRFLLSKIDEENFVFRPYRDLFVSLGFGSVTQLILRS